MLSADLRAINQQEYQRVVEEEYIETHIEHVYEELWRSVDQTKSSPDGHEIPFIGEIVENIFQEVYTNARLDLIEEAIDRHDHEEIYGLDVQEFRTLAFEQTIQDESLQPYIEYHLFERFVFKFMMDHHWFFKDYAHQLRNVPVAEVW